MSHAEIQHEFQIYPSDRAITVQSQQRRISSSGRVSPEGGGVELQLLEPPPGGDRDSFSVFCPHVCRAFKPEAEATNPERMGSFRIPTKATG